MSEPCGSYDRSLLDVESGEAPPIGVYFTDATLQKEHRHSIARLLEGRKFVEYEVGAEEKYHEHRGDTVLVGNPVSVRLDAKLEALGQARRDNRNAYKSVVVLVRRTTEKTGASNSFDCIVDLIPDSAESRSRAARTLAPVLHVGPTSASAAWCGGVNCSKGTMIACLVLLVLLALGSVGGVVWWKSRAGPSPNGKAAAQVKVRAGDVQSEKQVWFTYSEPRGLLEKMDLVAKPVGDEATPAGEMWRYVSLSQGEMWDYAGKFVLVAISASVLVYLSVRRTERVSGI